MKNYQLWKIFIVFILVSLGVVFAIPSILYQEDTGNWYLKRDMYKEAERAIEFVFRNNL